MNKKLKTARTILYVVSGATILISFMWLFTPRLLPLQETFINMVHEQLQPNMAALFLILYKIIGINFLALGITFAILAKGPFIKNDVWARRIILVSVVVFAVYAVMALQLNSPTFVVPLALAILVITALVISKSSTNKNQDDVQFNPEGNKMKELNIGFSFRETMEGGFSLGEADPKAGEKKGKAQGQSLSMHATVSISDLQKFISDPNHNGGLTGNIDFTPFGENIPATKGAFNLFSPTDDPKLKLMVYELAFEHGGEDYYLAGKKKVKDDPGFDLWSDTTTLYTKLHKGTDKSGPVVGAGILSLNVKELIKLVSTMEVNNAKSGMEKAQALSNFGSLFLGDLWDSYAKMAS